MAKLITVYWRDIPAQVIGRSGRGRIKRELPPRFAKAIDRAAMRAGRGSSDAYLADWRRESRQCDSDLQEAVESEAARLELQFTEDKLEAMIRSGGIQADKPAEQPGCD